MPTTLIPTCPLCGLRFTVRLLLDLHIREDHVRPQLPDRRPDRAELAHQAAAPAWDQPEPGEEKE